MIAQRAAGAGPPYFEGLERREDPYRPSGPGVRRRNDQASVRGTARGRNHSRADRAPGERPALRRPRIHRAAEKAPSPPGRNEGPRRPPGRGILSREKGVQMVVSQKNQRLGAPFHDFAGHPAVAGEDLLSHVLGGHIVPQRKRGEWLAANAPTILAILYLPLVGTREGETRQRRREIFIRYA